MPTPVPNIKLNGRFYSHRPTGMQRYALELVKRIGDRLDIVRPNRPLRGGIGHMWEQAYLPFATGQGLLWSPNNTGPLRVSRQVCTVHDLIPLDHPEWFSPKFVGLYRWLMPRLMSKLQHVIAISEFTKSKLIEHFDLPPSRITVVLNGVDQAYQPRDQSEITDVRTRFNLGEKPYVLSVCSLEPRKNLKRLLEAWERLPANLKNEYQLVLAGARGNSSVFGDAGLDNAPRNTVFTGYVSQQDLPLLYAGAAIFAYPSVYEGFGLPPLEAMACGVPVLTSNTTSLPEVVGEAGLSVDPTDVDALADGLQRLMGSEELRRRLSASGLARSRQLSWDVTAVETWRVLEREALLIHEHREARVIH